jgi:hypothetical protein
MTACFDDNSPTGGSTRRRKRAASACKELRKRTFAMSLPRKLLPMIVGAAMVQLHGFESPN